MNGYNLRPLTTLIMSSNELSPRGYTAPQTTAVVTRGFFTNVSVDKNSCCKTQSKFPIFLFEWVIFLKDITLPKIKDLLSQCTNYAGETECDSGQKRERSESSESDSKGHSSKRQRQSHSTSDALVSSSNSSGSGDDERDRDRQRIPHSATCTVAKARKKRAFKRGKKRGMKHMKKYQKKSSKVKHRRSSRAGQRRSHIHGIQVSPDIFVQKGRRQSHCNNPRNPIRFIRRRISLHDNSLPEPTDSEDGGDFSVTTKWSESCNAAMVPLDCSLVPPNVMIPLKPPIVVSREMPQIRMDPPSVLEITPNVITNLDPDSKYSRNVSAVFDVNRTSAIIVPGVGVGIKQNDRNKHKRSSKLVSGVSYADKVKNYNGETSSSNNPAQQVCVQTIPSAHVRKKGETDAPLGDALQDYTGGAHAIGEDTLNQTDCTPPDSTASNVAITLQQQNSKAIISQFVPSIVEYSSPVGTNTGSLVSQSLSGQSSDASEASTDTDIMTHQNRPPVQEPPDNTAPLASQSMVVLPLRHQPSEIEASALQAIPLSFPREESRSRNRTKLLTRQHSLTQTHTFENNSLGWNEQDYDQQALLAVGNDQIQIHSWTQSVQESERNPVQNFCIVLPTSEWHFRPPHAQIVDGINQEELSFSPVQSQPEVTGIAQHLGSSDYRSFSALVEILRNLKLSLLVCTTQFCNLWVFMHPLMLINCNYYVRFGQLLKLLSQYSFIRC